MAQSGYTPILIYASSTPGALPSAANLTSSASGAELAINYADGKLYFKNSSGVVTLLAGSSSGPAGGSNTQVQYNSSGVLAGSSNMTFNGTKLTVAGFLDSALTSGRVPYATTSGELIDSANLLYSGTDLTVYGITVGRGAGGDATNTAVGASALANTSGAFNVAVGANAASNATSFANATVVGMNAISTGVATGTYITAIGTSSLQKLTSGSYITGVGVLALKENTTGSYNTALGVEALQANTTASNNTAVGYQALYLHSTGDNNLALGHQAGYSNTSTAYNVFCGYQAGYYTTGGSNTFVGSQAGVSVTSGTKNTIIGQYGGNQGGLDIRTANNYIVLSDGDGNPRVVSDDGGGTYFTRRNFGGGSSTSGSSNWWYVGKWVISSGAQSARIRIVVPGANGYGTSEFGETIINAGIDNTNAVTGVFYALTNNSVGLAGVAVKYDTDGYVFYFKGGAFRSNATLVDTTAGYWVGAHTDTGSTTQPAGTTALDSRFNLNTNGTTVLDVTDGQALALQGATRNSGTGITFPATLNASSNANTLDDYEEGTWTPTNAGDATGTLSYAIGEYVKVGRLVYLRGVVDISANFTGSLLGGLPFTPSGNTAATSLGPSNIVMNSGSANLAFGINIDLQCLTFFTDNNVNNAGGLTTANDILRFSITYQST